MDCASARRVLREVAGPAAPTADLASAQQHLRQCAACQRWRSAEQEWRNALREKLPRLETPLPVKERLFAALARGRLGAELRRQRRRWSAAVVVLCLAGVLLGALGWRHERMRGDFLVAALSEDHLLYAGRPDPAEIASGDPAAVARWLAGRLDFAVAEPGLRGTELLGGRLCTLVDRRVALWFYQSGGRRVSLFQMPAHDLPLGSLRVMTVDGRHYRCGHRKGVTVLAWTERDVLFALVSDLPENELIRLAPS